MGTAIGGVITIPYNATRENRSLDANASRLFFNGAFYYQNTYGKKNDDEHDE